MQKNDEAITTTCATIVKLDSDFIKVTVKSGIAIDTPQVDELTLAYDSLVGLNKPFYIVTALPEDLNPSKDLRDRWRDSERSKRKLAEAVVIRGTAMTIIANFVHKMETPEHRVRYFKEEEEAIAWIKKTRLRDMLPLAERDSEQSLS